MEDKGETICISLSTKAWKAFSFSSFFPLGSKRKTIWESFPIGRGWLPLFAPDPPMLANDNTTIYCFLDIHDIMPESSEKA